jgi:hypothetical protein
MTRLQAVLAAVALGGGVGLMTTGTPAAAQQNCHRDTGCVLNQCTGQFLGYWCQATLSGCSGGSEPGGPC